MHSYTKQGVDVIKIYKVLLFLSFGLSVSFGYISFHLIKKEEIDSIFSIYSLILSGMPLAVFYIVFAIFNQWIWKWKWINNLINVPDLNGIYKGYLKSSFDNFSKNYEFELKISQNFDNIEIFLEMKADSSKSYSISAYLEKRNNETIVVYNYQNEPLDKTCPTLTEHKGTAILMFDLGNKSFRGSYYTDKRPINEKEHRCNFGEMKGKLK